MVVGANLFVCSFSKLWCIVVQFPITSRKNRITRLVAFQRAELGLEADIKIFNLRCRDRIQILITILRFSENS